MMKLLQDAEWSHWSDREIAKHAKVDGKTVARLRSEIAPAIDTCGNPDHQRRRRSSGPDAMEVPRQDRPRRQSPLVRGAAA